MQPVRTALPGLRWHFAHGPIELVIGADGSHCAVAAAHEAAWQRFATVLQELVDELPLLRQPVRRGPCPLQGGVAQRMWRACAALPVDFITPMAAVAGAVAQEVIGVYARAGLQRAYVNNGGDIALHLEDGAEWRVGLVADIARRHPGLPTAGLDGAFTVHSTDPVRGIATSGWRGRSHSLGMADAVTVLAATAAQADAAATVIANAVNVQDPRVVRAPANSLRDDSDLGERPVTVHVPALPAATVAAALQSGWHCAQQLQQAGLIHAAVLLCQGQALRLDPSHPALRQAA
jgi:uncharacterized protein